MLNFDANSLLEVIVFLVYIIMIGIFVIRRDLINILLCIELLVLVGVVLLLVYSLRFDDLSGYIFILVLLTISASESALILSILVYYYQLTSITNIDLVTSLKG